MENGKKENKRKDGCLPVGKLALSNVYLPVIYSAKDVMFSVLTEYLSVSKIMLV